jgi:CxxC motif-containing protein
MVTREGDEYVVTGAKCKKGIPYAISEVENPQRFLTTTVATTFKDIPRLSVKTDRPIPLGRTFEFMAIINTLMVDTRLVPSDVILENIAGSGVNLVATDNMKQVIESVEQE